MPNLNFTARTVAAIKPPASGRDEHWDVNLEGFGLRISSSGARSWVVMYRLSGQGLLRRYTIGKVQDISLADARAKARSIRAAAAKGIDPGREKREAREAETFLELANEYLEKHAKVNKKSWKKDERVLKRDVLPRWKNIKAKEIRRRDVIKLLDDTVKRGAPVHANRVLALVRKIFNFGIEKEIVEMNPCQLVKRPTDEKPRQGQRVLSFEELRAVWRAFETQPPLTAGIFKLRTLLLQRGSEIRSMEKSELDLENGWWTLPGSKTKNKLSHRVPISPQAHAVIAALAPYNEGSRFVFPSPINNDQHIDNIQKAVQRVRRLSGVSFVERDLRRTGASHMTGHLKVMRLTVSKILNHVETGITKVYDRHSYDDEKRAALHAWGECLERLLMKGPGAIVAKQDRGAYKTPQFLEEATG